MVRFALPTGLRDANVRANASIAGSAAAATANPSTETYKIANPSLRGRALRLNQNGRKRCRDLDTVLFPRCGAP